MRRRVQKRTEGYALLEVILTVALVAAVGLGSSLILLKNTQSMVSSAKMNRASRLAQMVMEQYQASAASDFTKLRDLDKTSVLPVQFFKTTDNLGFDDYRITTQSSYNSAMTTCNIQVTIYWNSSTGQKTYTYTSTLTKKSVFHIGAAVEIHMHAPCGNYTNFDDIIQNCAPLPGMRVTMRSASGGNATGVTDSSGTLILGNVDPSPLNPTTIIAPSFSPYYTPSESPDYRPMYYAPILTPYTYAGNTTYSATYMTSLSTTVPVASNILNRIVLTNFRRATIVKGTVRSDHLSVANKHIIINGNLGNDGGTIRWCMVWYSAFNGTTSHCTVPIDDYGNYEVANIVGDMVSFWPSLSAGSTPEVQPGSPGFDWGETDLEYTGTPDSYRVSLNPLINPSAGMIQEGYQNLGSWPAEPAAQVFTGANIDVKERGHVKLRVLDKSMHPITGANVSLCWYWTQNWHYIDSSYTMGPDPNGDIRSQDDGWISPSYPTCGYNSSWKTVNLPPTDSNGYTYAYNALNHILWGRLNFAVCLPDNSECFLKHWDEPGGLLSNAVNNDTRGKEFNIDLVFGSIFTLSGNVQANSLSGNISVSVDPWTSSDYVVSQIYFPTNVLSNMTSTANVYYQNGAMSIDNATSGHFSVANLDAGPFGASPTQAFVGYHSDVPLHATVSGELRDLDTGAPMANYHMFVGYSSQKDVSGNYQTFNTTTDSSGRWSVGTQDFVWYTMPTLQAISCHSDTSQCTTNTPDTLDTTKGAIIANAAVDTFLTNNQALYTYVYSTATISSVSPNTILVGMHAQRFVVSGIITDSVTGQPVSGIQLTASGGGGGWVTTTSDGTDGHAKGYYIMGVPVEGRTDAAHPGTLKVIVSDQVVKRVSYRGFSTTLTAPVIPDANAVIQCDGQVSHLITSTL